MKSNRRMRMKRKGTIGRKKTKRRKVKRKRNKVKKFQLTIEDADSVVEPLPDHNNLIDHLPLTDCCECVEQIPKAMAELCFNIMREKARYYGIAQIGDSARTCIKRLLEDLYSSIGCHYSEGYAKTCDDIDKAFEDNYMVPRPYS